MKNNKKKLTLDRYVYDWVTTYLPKLRISSTATLRTYKRALNIFLEYLELSGVTELTPDNLSPSVVNNWMKWLVEKRGNSATTCNSRLAAIKVLLSTLALVTILSVVYISTSLTM
jgi:site-specific recombinase XerD